MSEIKTNPKDLGLKARLKFLFKDSAVYGGAHAVRTLFALFTFPILARYFSVEDYGIIDAFNALATLLTAGLIFGQDSAVARFFYEYDDKTAKKNVVSQSLLIQLAFMAIIVPVLIWQAGFITREYIKQENLLSLTKLVIWRVPFGLLMNFSSNILKWTFKKWQYLVVQLGSSFTQVIAVIIAIFIFKIGVYQVFEIALGVRIVFSLLGMYFVRNWLTIKVNHKHYGELIKYAAPLGILVLIFSALPVSDRYFIDHYLTPLDLGLYAVAYKIAALIKLPVSAFQTAWGPFYLSLFKEKDAEETYNMVLVLFTVFLSVLGLTLSLFAKQMIVVLAGRKYISAAILVLPLVYAVIVMSFGWILAIGIDLSKKSYQKLLSALIRFVVSVGTILLLINKIGLLSIGIAAFLSFTIMVVYETIIAFRVYPLRFNLRAPLLILTGSFVLALSFYGLTIENMILDSLIKVMAIFLFLFAMWWWPLKRKNILLMIQKQMKKS